MSLKHIAFLVFAIAFLLTGCGEKTPAQKPLAATPVAAGKTNAEPNAGQPQPKLATVKLWIGREEMTAEVAATESQVTNGMMFRTSIADNEGMLFVFPVPIQAAFWMKNTLLPLSCAYLDSEGRILEIHELKAQDETLVRAATDQVRYALEARAGGSSATTLLSAVSFARSKARLPKRLRI